MADHTQIEWTDATWNPIRGCTRVSPGCGGGTPGDLKGGCYAERVAARFSGPGQPYEGLAEMTGRKARWTGKLRLVEDTLLQPLRWKRPRRIFVNSMSDLFHEALTDEQIDRVFAVMALAPQHAFQVLTKRSSRMRDYLSQDWAARGRFWVENLTLPTISEHAARTQDRLRRYTSPGLPAPLENVWLGVSAEDQARADERVPDLLATPAAIRFVSAEPLLGPITFINWLRALDWIIVGGESGRGARPMHPDWAREIRDQCEATGTAFFFKQWGEFAPTGLPSEAWHVAPGMSAVSDPLPNGIGRHVKEGHWRTYRVGKKAAGRLLDGVTHDAMPEAAASA